MKKQLVATFIILLLPFAFGSCVSSLLKEAPPTFSNEILIKSPTKPFVKTETSIYPSWKNTQTGNVISIISDCKENSPYKLSNLHLILESSLENIQVSAENTITLNNKPAFHRVIKAQLDGSPIEIQSVSFKRKSCGYVASLSGKENNLSTDQKQFEQFINGFSFK